MIDCRALVMGGTQLVLLELVDVKKGEGLIIFTYFFNDDQNSFSQANQRPR
jgi:hypothetical protein